MIYTSMQLKAKIRNMSGGDSRKALTLIRNYLMECFLERISKSKYRDKFILKGGMLVAAIVGLDTRATMDIDTTVRAINLTMENAREVIQDIISVGESEPVNFSITKMTEILEGHDYRGIRITLEASLETMRQTIQIDISTGDVITPRAIEYSYPLMFENRSICLCTYNIESLLAEKFETILSRTVTNTRMRDFYDIYTLIHKEIDKSILKEAVLATSKKRNTLYIMEDTMDILDEIEEDRIMNNMWEKYKLSSFYVNDISWEEVMKSVRTLADWIS